MLSETKRTFLCVYREKPTATVFFKDVSKTKQNIYVCTVKVVYCYEYVLFINHFYIVLQVVFCHKILHCSTIATQGVNILPMGRRFCRNKSFCVINLQRLVGWCRSVQLYQCNKKKNPASIFF